MADDHLITLAARGNAEALEALARAHRPSVLRTARHLLGDDDAAEDVAQDAFVRLQNALGGFRAEAELSTWLYRVTLNLCRDHVRRRRRRPEVPLDAVAHRAESVAADPERSVAVGRARRAIEAAIAKLPEDQREVVTLRFVAELRYVEIARVTGLPEGTVASRVFRALQRLSRDLEPIHMEIVR